MASAVVGGGGSVLELSSNGVENQEGGDTVPEFPAVIVEPVPSARLEQGYAAQVLVYDDETYMMQDVAEEQEVETENSETVEASVHSSNAHCTDKTIEAAEALLHMESPTCLRDSRSPGLCLPTCLCAVCMPDIHGCQKRIGPSGTGVTDGWELLCGCWEL